jgi:hypothetical protein
MLMVVGEDRQPALSRLLELIHSDVGLRPLERGMYLMPADLAPHLQRMESAASQLDLTYPAPEDLPSVRAVSEGEAPRYVDCEAASFAVGTPDVSDAIAGRVTGGLILQQGLECFREYLERWK